MALHGCLRCVKVVVFSLNFIVWLTGMGVLGLSLYLRMDIRTNHLVKASYDSHLTTYHIVCYTLISIGGLMTFLGFLGCCGAFQESKCMLGTLFTLMVVLFAGEVAGGVWTIMNKETIEGNITQTFKDIIQKEYGKDQHQDESIDYVQTKLQCCGADQPTDWRHSYWENRDMPDRINHVPASCCIDGGIEGSGICEVIGPWVDGEHRAVWKQGCGDKLLEELQRHILLVIGVALGIAGIELLSMCFSLVLCCGMMKQSHGGYKS